MSRRIKLTLVSAVLMAGLAAAVSAFYLANQVDRQFQSVSERADTLFRLAADAVVRSVEMHPDLSVSEAVASDADLAGRLLALMTNTRVVLDLAVCDTAGRILVTTDTTRPTGTPFPAWPDYGRLASDPILPRVRALFASGQTDRYQLSRALESQEEGPLLSIRLVIYPGLIREELLPDLQKAGLLSLGSVAGSALAALIFFGYAFRPLSRVTQMLDHLTRGEYVPAPPPPHDRDEFGAVLTKVGLLGQQLGNVDRLLDRLEEGVLIFGRDRTVTVASGALEMFLGKRRAELTGKPLAEVFPPREPAGSLLLQIAETGKSVQNVRFRLGGRSAALVSVEVLEKGAGMLVRLRDPEVRRRIQGQLQTAERLAAISRVSGGLAHEVKNPLNAILMHVDWARMKLARGDTVIEPQMEIIEKEILRLDRVVKTFLDFERPADLNLAEVAVDPMVSELIELARPQAAAAGVEVKADLRANGAAITADADRLKQALLNIVVNAIEAMPDGGSLHFESAVADEEAEIRIADTGCGIPPELRAKIFQLYFTTKPAGSGIGLAVTYRMVQLHGGKIDFSSEPGKGTTFSLRFPLAAVA